MVTDSRERRDNARLAERALIQGDLRQLTPAERVAYYMRSCESLGLNPWTKPFQYVSLGNQLVLYPKKDATDQLRRRDGVSIEIVSRELLEDAKTYVVLARARTPDGRTDESLGAVWLGNLQGEAIANAIMRCETKAKRRVTLSICGLGWSDESEISGIGTPVVVDDEGVIHDRERDQLEGAPGRASLPPGGPGEGHPDTHPDAREQEPARADGLTASQLRAVYAIARSDLGWSDEETERRVGERYDGRRPSELSKAEASSVISWLKEPVSGGLDE
jgi:hypothetical protein